MEEESLDNFVLYDSKVTAVEMRRQKKRKGYKWHYVKDMPKYNNIQRTKAYVNLVEEKSY